MPQPRMRVEDKRFCGEEPGLQGIEEQRGGEGVRSEGGGEGWDPRIVSLNSLLIWFLLL